MYFNTKTVLIAVLVMSSLQGRQPTPVAFDGEKLDKALGNIHGAVKSLNNVHKLVTALPQNSQPAKNFSAGAIPSLPNASLPDSTTNPEDIEQLEPVESLPQLPEVSQMFQAPQPNVVGQTSPQLDLQSIVKNIGPLLSVLSGNK